MNRLWNNNRILVIGIVLVFLVIGYLNSNADSISEPLPFASNVEQKEDEKELEWMAHIDGEVHSPGVYVILEGERLADLIEKAGGLTSDANAKALNLAMKIEDEMKIYVPNLSESPEEADMSNSGNSSKININRASVSELITLPGIGEQKAQKIIDYREDQPFETIEELMNISGIGDKTFESLKELISVR